MDYKQKKEQLEKEFNKNRDTITQYQQALNQLATRQEQLKGQFQLITEIEKESGENRASKRRIEKLEEKVEENKEK